jgi:hypothetical protein
MISLRVSKLAPSLALVCLGGGLLLAAEARAVGGVHLASELAFGACNYPPYTACTRESQCSPNVCSNCPGCDLTGVDCLAGPSQPCGCDGDCSTELGLKCRPNGANNTVCCNTTISGQTCLNDSWCCPSAVGALNSSQCVNRKCQNCYLSGSSNSPCCSGHTTQGGLCCAGPGESCVTVVADGGTDCCPNMGLTCNGKGTCCILDSLVVITRCHANGDCCSGQCNLATGLCSGPC